jgi:uncharacterized damage-inducible protein DinB
MKYIFLSCFLLLVSAPFVSAKANHSTAVFEDELQSMEREFVPLVEAMPADKFNFAPSNGAFKGVRTFGMQSKHVAYVLNEIASGLLSEKNPSMTAAHENGPDELKSKEEIVKYVKDAFAYMHRAFATLTDENLLSEITDPFDAKRKMARVKAANIVFWHTYDHYGQMVVYARMNDVVPPASR